MGSQGSTTQGNVHFVGPYLTNINNDLIIFSLEAYVLLCFAQQSSLGFTMVFNHVLPLHTLVWPVHLKCCEQKLLPHASQSKGSRSFSCLPIKFRTSFCLCPKQKGHHRLTTKKNTSKLQPKTISQQRDQVVSSTVSCCLQ